MSQYIIETALYFASGGGTINKKFLLQIHTEKKCSRSKSLFTSYIALTKCLFLRKINYVNKYFVPTTKI